MKRFLLLFAALTLISTAFAQKKAGETTIKRFSFGADIFADIWMNQPKGVDVRTINQGMNVFGMYNYPFKPEGRFSFAFGIGGGFHNMYSNSVIKDIKADSIEFVVIPDSVSYKKSKISMTYIDIPFEFRYKSPTKFRVAVGFKIGYLLDGKTKYKGNNIHGDQYIEKQKQINFVEKFRFGPHIRVGYHWFSIYAYYQVTSIFQRNKGPNNLYPISVGITLLPF